MSDKPNTSASVIPFRIAGRTGSFEVVIGLEVHAQITAQSKLFSGAATTFGAEPNSQVSLVDAGFPGMLPVINAHCVKQAVKTGLGLNAEINLVSVFDRKNYFYADLPSGYQISQYTQPIVGKGSITIDLDDGSTKEIGITRLHLEQDAGKSLHDQHPERTFIDLNRAGVALMEIVSEPDLRSPQEAAAYLRKLRSILRYLDTCDGNMDEGSMRCDCNVSVRRPGASLGTRCEIKNVNSIRFVAQAIDYEARRQVELLESGGTVNQETRLFDAASGTTRAMRSKENAHDYRYFPDPDLLPLVLDVEWVEEIRQELPELPDARRDRFTNQLGLSPYDAKVLVAERSVADFFEAVVADRNANMAAHWITGELFALLKKTGLDIESSPVSSEALGQLLDLIGDGTISGKMAKDVLADMVLSLKAPAQIIDEKGLRQISDEGLLESFVAAVLAAQPDKVVAYKNGKEALFSFFVGQVMKSTQGKANPRLVDKLLWQKLHS